MFTPNLGQEAGAQPVQRLGLKTSSSTLLRPLHNAKLTLAPSPTVIGVDDFAFLKDMRYETVIVDSKGPGPWIYSRIGPPRLWRPGSTNSPGS